MLATQADGGAAVSAAEVARFDALAARWWDPRGPMAPLHRMNPARVAWIASRAAAQFGAAARPALLDVGCGAGLAAEALARRGFDVTGLDAAPSVIAAARRHAEGQALPLAYRVGVVEDLAAEAARFPVVTALEVIEHVPDQAAFLRGLAAVLAPGGLLVLSTLNRTPRSLLLAKFAAEYLLRLLPVGTHDWRRFVTPAELAAQARAARLRTLATSGLNTRDFGRTWHTGGDLEMNYLAAFTRP
jgi:2-polyprenyl-6-hydroxyphenyl methylase/3-demethylubiquinone-9 3-methyltransferase